MKAMLIEKTGRFEDLAEPVAAREIPEPKPGPGQALLRVAACGVCHTELDEIEGRTPPPRLPVVPGHQVVGRVAALGPGARRFKEGDRVGVAWIYSACGECAACRGGQENLCPDFKATGRDANGGYAEAMVVAEAFATPIPPVFEDAEAGALLWAGAVGYRALRLTNIQPGQNLGLTGFGASGHLVLKLVRTTQPKTNVFVFSRSPAERQDR